MKRVPLLAGAVGPDRRCACSRAGRNLRPRRPEVEASSEPDDRTGKLKASGLIAAFELLRRQSLGGQGLFCDHGALAVDEGKPWFGLSCVIAEVNSVRISVLLEPQKGS